MARLLGPSEATRLVVGVDGNYFTTRRNTSVVMYTSSALTALADVREDDNGAVGAAHSGSAVPTDSLSALVDFWFPDGVDTVWYRDASGAARPVYAQEDDRIDALEATSALLNAVVFNVTDPLYGATGDGVTDDTAEVQAAITACGTAGGGVVYFPPGFYQITSSLAIAASKVRLRGSGRGVTTLRYTGSAGTACLGDDPSATRFYCGVDDLTVSCITVGAVALRLQNAYRWTSHRSSFESQNGTTGIALDGDGALANACYLNTFDNCDFWGSLASVKLNDNVNGWRFVGGVLEGPGYAVWMPGTTSNSGTMMFVGVAIQSEGTNTAGVIIQLGTTGAQLFKASYNTFVACRIETSAATTIVNENNGFYNAIIGGSIGGTTTIVDNIVAPNTGAQVLVLVNGGPPFVLPKTVSTYLGFVASKGTAGEHTLDGSGVRATGTNAAQNLPLVSKGTGIVRVNQGVGNGTGGFAVDSGGASPALRAQLGPNRAADFYPAAGNDAVRVFKSTNTAQRIFAVSEDGTLNWGDTTASPDTSLSRQSAKVVGVAADHCLRTGRNVTGSRPVATAVGAGAVFYDTTLSKPVWSDGTVWRDAAGTVV